jgi:N utilization substance protein B
MSRRAARETAMMLLYQSEITRDFFEETLSTIKEEEFFTELHGTETTLTDKDQSYIRETITGVKEKIEDIDRQIEAVSIEWSIRRMSRVDLSILRLAVFEMQNNSTVPAQVAINEAVELAKKYGDDKTAKFINGVLGQILRVSNE